MHGEFAHPLAPTNAVVQVSASLSGLSPTLPYSCRLVVIGGGAANYGADQFFYTRQTALSFNGSNAFVSIPPLNLSASHSLSLEVWIRP